MKQKQKCSSCGKDYWVSMIKVYVFKKHTCPVDRTELAKSAGSVFTCPKCNKVFSKTVPVDYMKMGTRIDGSTRSFDEKEKRLIEEPNVEVDNVMVPAEPMCQRCRNYQTKAAQATVKRERKLSSGLPDDIKMVPETVTNSDVYKYEIFRKIQTDFQETRKAEAYERQKAERAVAEAERQKKLAETLKKPETLMPTKEEMQPLIDPEAMRIEQEARAKDIHIEELKKRAEDEKKLREDLKKQDAKIARLKKKLEESKKAEEQ